MFKIAKRIIAGLAAACCIIATIPTMITSFAAETKYEAENGTLDAQTNATVKSDSTASGGKYLSCGDSFNITFKVTVDKTGYYDVNVVSKSIGTSDKQNYVKIGTREEIFVSHPDAFSSSTAKNIKLEKGENELSITNFYGYIDFDYFTISESSTSTEDYYSDATRKLINPNATASTKRLMKFICDNYGKNVITGQQSDNGYNSGDMKGIYDFTGEYPALVGMDLMNYSLSSVKEHDATSNTIEKAKEVSDAGGIVSLCWHWRMYDEYLKSGNDKDNKPRWWGAFYTENIDKTKFNLTEAMNNPDSKLYKQIVADIDYIAEQLKKLQDLDVPVLFRPLHEGGGDYANAGNNSWFWWGTGGSDTYIKLWKLMYDRITNVAGVNNLIWVWNGQVPSYYPGDDYVDIIGEDIYNARNDYVSNYFSRFQNALGYTNTHKVIALSENGTLFDFDEAFGTNAKWSYFCSWTSDYSISGSYNNADNKAIWKKVYNNDKAITLSKVPYLKAYPLDPADEVAADSVKLNSDKLDMEIGDKNTLVTTFSPQNASDVPTWTSSNEKVATVDERGTVTAVGAGEAVITCKINNGQTSTCTVSVIPSQITDLKADSATGNSIKLSWTAVPTATKYEVEVMDKDGKSIKVESTSTNSIEIKDLSPETSYKFRVRAIANIDGKDYVGSYSSIIDASTVKGGSTDNSGSQSDNSSNDSSNSNGNGSGSGSGSKSNTNNSGSTDSSADTGATAAIAAMGIVLAGSLLVITKKNK